MSNPFSYDEQVATLELIIREREKYYAPIHITFANWTFSHDKEIHWLSDREFIIKATRPHMMYEEEPPVFYLRFRFKPDYFK